MAREEWHGHVTALSVAPEFRRLGLAAKLMEMLEEISERSADTAYLNVFLKLKQKGPHSVKSHKMIFCHHDLYQRCSQHK